MHQVYVSDTPTPPADPLRALVVRYLESGDEEAMDRIVEATRPKLLAVARRIGDAQDAEDAVQGAYLSLLRKRGGGLDAPVLPWLLTTVIRLAYRRKAVQRRQQDLARHLAQPHEGDVRTAPAPVSSGEVHERESLVRSSVARLPRVYRDAVVLRHLEGLPTKDVAILLDVPETTVRTRLFRAARLLRSKMAPALLALLLFLPWCAADVWRHVSGQVQLLFSRPAVAYSVVSGLLVAAVGLALGLTTYAGGTAARPSAAVSTTSAERTAPAGPTVPPPAPRPPARPEEEPGNEHTPTVLPPIVPAPSVDLPEKAPAAEEMPSKAPDGRERYPDLDPLPPVGLENIASGHVVSAEAPAGMSFLEGGHVQIGTTPEEWELLLAGRPEPIRRLFLFERPRHIHELAPYYIGRYEVSNAQYQVFLEDERVTYRVGQGELETLEDIAAHLVGLSAEQKADPSSIVWRQLYEANKGAIWRALAKERPNALVWRKDHSVDEEQTALQLRRLPLPSGLTLDFYRIAPPDNWVGMLPPEGQRDHPVRFVSHDNAERLAEWAGLRLPTEEEWEWAARGPDARRYPWGETWDTDGRRANWGGHVHDAHYETSSVEVDAVLSDAHDGRSWCGAFHMVGNVAEWTSSWFTPYPGDESENAFFGRWVKVLRGGGAADAEPLVLRSACRNWIGDGADAPPYPDARFRWSGFRLAASRVPARDHVGPIVRRALRARRLEPDAVARERFVGMVTRNWVSPAMEPVDHVYVLGAARALLFVPLRSFLRDAGLPDQVEAWRKPARFRRQAGLLKASRGMPWPLGVLHSDMPLDGVQVPAGAASAQGPRHTAAPETTSGRVAGGTWLLCLWHERLALMTPSLEFVAFLPASTDRHHPSVEVRSHPSKQVGTPTQRLTREAGEGHLDFQLPLGGKTRDPRWFLAVHARLPFAPGSLDAPFAWQHSHRDR